MNAHLLKWTPRVDAACERDAAVAINGAGQATAVLCIATLGTAHCLAPEHGARLRLRALTAAHRCCCRRRCFSALTWPSYSRPRPALGWHQLVPSRPQPTACLDPAPPSHSTAGADHGPRCSRMVSAHVPTACTRSNADRDLFLRHGWLGRCRSGGCFLPSFPSPARSRTYKRHVPRAPLAGLTSAAISNPFLLYLVLLSKSYLMSPATADPALSAPLPSGRFSASTSTSSLRACLIAQIGTVAVPVGHPLSMSASTSPHEA